MASPSRAPSKARALWDALAREVLSPPARLSVPDFVARHRVITGHAAAVEGPWQHWRTPHLVTPMRLIGRAGLGGDPEVREVVVMSAAQCGKTELLINGVLAVLAQEPVPVLWTVPNEDWAATFTATRFYPALAQCPPVAALATAARAKKNLLLTLANGASIAWAGSNSDANNRGRPAGVRLVDELDSAGFDYGVLQDVRDRAAAWPGSMLVVTSTPSFEGMGIDREYRMTDQRKWYVPCPLDGCGHYQVLGFDGLVWEGSTQATAAHVARTLRYQCAKCRGGVPPTWNAWMQARGVWCPRGVRPTGDGTKIPAELVRDGYLDDRDPAVLDALKLEGEPAVTTRRRAGFHITGLCSLLREGGWISVAQDFVAAKGHPDRKFWNNTLGAPWSDKGDCVPESELRKLCAPAVALGGYERGELPGGPGPRGDWTPPAWGAMPVERAATLGLAPARGCCGPVALVGTVDVQVDRCYLLINAYGALGETVWTVWFDEVYSPEKNELAELDGLGDWWFGWQRPSPAASPRELTALRVLAWGIDSGDRTKHVYSLVRRLRANPANDRLLFHPVKGQGEGGGSALARPVWKSMVDVDADGRAVPGAQGGLELVNVRVGVFKDDLFARLQASGRIHLPFPSRAEGRAFDDLFRSLCSEHRLPVTSKDGRFTPVESRWVKRWGIAGKVNHYWDCFVYNLALAELLGVRTLVPSGWGRGGGGAAVAGATAGGERGSAPERPVGRGAEGFVIDAEKAGGTWI